METLSTGRATNAPSVVTIKLLQPRFIKCETKIGTCNIKQYDVSNLKDPDVKEEFNITIINRYSTLQDETAVTIDQFHQAVTENATEA